ncbi:hypothetical protein [Rhizobium sp. SSA_523]|uniref:hypothetical protein n=1 Tax=Rhizobium sp. SSA_523 TaxID=2952477 RepID=UPI0020909FD5|nr:hypothetical protein [Rhizobium sp. SSA_523]MCO5730343.1 hypothetical protein [Rhizobium sp. SSA_523]WKC25391.1 hypothetical protein QTJ18_15595 [Rhizobium sp. SSA_523]
MSLSNTALTVQSTAVSTLIVQGHGTAAVATHGHSMTEASISLQRFANSPWIRVTIVDSAGRRAWTNPIWF